MFISQEKLIKKIHTEFDEAQDKLLMEAQKLLSTTVEDKELEVAKRLEKVGFGSTPLAQKVYEREHTKVLAKKKAELISYYKHTYPFLKFITIDELDRICKKYNLIYATVSRYIKDVPEKNLRDIENAQPLKEEDRYNADIYAQIKIEKQRLLNRDSLSSNFIRYLQSRIDHEKEELFIAAPKDHFNLRGLVQDGFGFFRPKVKDPIVFRYVRGGVQIITKWGLEAEDPALIVEKLN